MRLHEEILSELGGGGDPLRIKYTVVDGKGGYFQNVKRLLEFSPQRIVLKGRAGQVTVEGEALSLGKYCLGDVTVLGEITCVKKSD